MSPGLWYPGTMDAKPTAAEMLELVTRHFRTAHSGPPTTWDWSIPYHLLDAAPGWTRSGLEAVVDFHHNGPARCR